MIKDYMYKIASFIKDLTYSKNVKMSYSQVIRREVKNFKGGLDKRS